MDEGFGWDLQLSLTKCNKYPKGQYFDWLKPLSGLSSALEELKVVFDCVNVSPVKSLFLIGYFALVYYSTLPCF